MFITRPHFGLCLSPLTFYHYHIRAFSSLPPHKICDADIKDATYVKALFLFSGSLPLAM
jgi:hypothetical protein